MYFVKIVAPADFAYAVDQAMLTLDKIENNYGIIELPTGISVQPKEFKLVLLFENRKTIVEKLLIMFIEALDCHTDLYMENKIMGKAFTDKERADVQGALRSIGLKLFAEKGIKGVSIRDITSEAGIAQGILHLL